MRNNEIEAQSFAILILSGLIFSFLNLLFDTNANYTDALVFIIAWRMMVLEAELIK